MPVAGARALLSATRAHSLPRFAFESSSHRRHLDARSFRTSSPRCARPDDSNASNGTSSLPDKPAADGGSSDKPGENQKPTEPGPALDAYKESLRSQGYGSARVRALRSKAVEEAPPFKIPAWFMRHHVSLLDPQRTLSLEDMDHLERVIANAELMDSSEVDAAIQNTNPDKLDELVGRLQAVQTVLRSPLSKRPEGPERSACLELLAAARTEMVAAAPRNTPSKKLNRPVTVLTVLNYKGPGAATSVIKDVAAELKADVVHLDASNIARIVGGYLGQTPYWSRSSTSMLGYAAAEINGRLLSRASENGSGGDEITGLFYSLPGRIRSFAPRKDSLLFGGVSDERWDDIKLGRALEQLVEAADTQRYSNRSSSSRRKDLIIHVHDYIELNSLAEGIINKLRSIVDRMWHNGRRVIIVGSSSTDIHDAPQWRSLLHSNKEEYHVIPFHVSENADDKAARENREATQENLDNISAMLRALVGSSSETMVDLNLVDDGAATVKPAIDLGKGIYDVHWVYRIATLMLGTETPRPPKFDIAVLNKALGAMETGDKQWTDLYPVRPPYFSPVFANSSSSNPNVPFLSIDPRGESGETSSSSKQYDSHEKKLLSGLINAKDIRTTFDDIVAPEATKDSLIALTSLALLQPEAFSYGVLKTERIPGCLLYGPPGTGKTLLAKAVAKESGANMLEVSAASINDMFVGQSEKNVRALFSLARKLAPTVIFLDEADALLGSRQSGHGRAAHRETITQFLREWDGLTDMKAFIMVATNRPFDLDEAVLRRLPRKLLVDLPLQDAREAILRVVLRDEALDESSLSLSALAAETDLYSGSDLKNLCVSAAMHAVRDDVRAQREAATAAAPPPPPPPVTDELKPNEAETTESVVTTATPLKRRVLTRAHFDKALAEISASISDDMESLKSIRKFDERYGDAGRRRKGNRSIGFEVVPALPGSEEARVRRALAA